MGVHPIDFLVTPRLLAMCVSIPLLIAQSIAFGIVASYVVGVHLFKVPGAYWNFNVERFTDGNDIAIAMMKGFVFGLLIVIVSCHQGLRARNGAVGVGRGTTDAMVFSSLAILIFNLFLTLLVQLIFPVGLGDCQMIIGSCDVVINGTSCDKSFLGEVQALCRSLING